MAIEALSGRNVLALGGLASGFADPRSGEAVAEKPRACSPSSRSLERSSLQSKRSGPVRISLPPWAHEAPLAVEVDGWESLGERIDIHPVGGGVRRQRRRDGGGPHHRRSGGRDPRLAIGERGRRGRGRGPRGHRRSGRCPDRPLCPAVGAPGGRRDAAARDGRGLAQEGRSPGEWPQGGSRRGRDLCRDGLGAWRGDGPGPAGRRRLCRGLQGGLLGGDRGGHHRDQPRRQPAPPWSRGGGGSTAGPWPGISWSPASACCSPCG